MVRDQPYRGRAQWQEEAPNKLANLLITNRSEPSTYLAQVYSLLIKYFIKIDPDMPSFVNCSLSISVQPQNMNMASIAEKHVLFHS